MEESEFKKLSANSRDWLIYSLLSKRSQEIFIEEDSPERIKQIKGMDHAIALDIGLEPKVETTVEETIQGIVRIVTDKAVQIVVGIRSAWIPKSAIKNVSSVVLEQGKPVSLDIHTWFVSKIEWTVI